MYIMKYLKLRYFGANLSIALRTTFLFLAFVFFGSQAVGQQLYLVAVGADNIETNAIDSVGYKKEHPNLKSVFEEANSLSDRLKKQGYFSNEVLEYKPENDSTFRFNYRLGEMISSIHIYIGANPSIRTLTFPDSVSDTIITKPNTTEVLIKDALERLERSGYSLAKIELKNIEQKGNVLQAELFVDPGNLRRVNDIVITGYEKFPQGHRKNIIRQYKNKTFNIKTLDQISNDFKKLRFVNQTRYPEILFKEDTTKVYVYLEKAKPNRFEGFVGFANDEEEKLTFSGYLDLMLVNFLNAGEDFTLYWKSDGQEQKTFNAELQVPYLFKSSFGIRASLNIFKQDSTFQNTRTAIGLGYYLNYNSQIFLNYEATESSDIQNQQLGSIADFKNAFATTQYDFTAFTTEDILFPERTSIRLKAGVGSRTSRGEKINQQIYQVNLMHNIILNKRNQINIRSQNFYLQSDQYLLSELHRFGGITSIRGFNENSLQGNMLTSLLTEYRFIPTPGLYIHSILDLGYYADESQSQATLQNNKLLGLGLGFGLLTKNGLLNLVYANGSTDKQAIKGTNSVVHISFRATF